MERILSRENFYFEEWGVENDNCVVLFNGQLYDELSINDAENLIIALKNSIKHKGFLDKMIEMNNRKILGTVRGNDYSEKPKPKIKGGFIYVAKCNRTGHYKIGSTSKQKVSDRISQLKTANSNIELLTSFETNDIKDEKYFHSIFESKKVSGEWFELNDLDLEEINNFYIK